MDFGFPGDRPLVEKTITSAELVAAFGRLREIWKQLFDEEPGPSAREEIGSRVRDDLDIVAAVAGATTISSAHAANSV